MKYSLAGVLAPYCKQLSYYYIQTRPNRNDTVSIVAVLCFKADTFELTAISAADQALTSLCSQMQQDLLMQAADMGIDTIFWDFSAEVHYDN